MGVEMVRELEGFKGQACLVKSEEAYFVVSSVVAMVTGYETLVFPANADGEVTSWGEVAGGRGMDRHEAIGNLVDVLEDAPPTDPSPLGEVA